jgi:hypothetical protein
MGKAHRQGWACRATNEPEQQRFAAFAGLLVLRQTGANEA